MSHQQFLVLVELDRLDNRLLDPQQGVAIRWRSARRSPLFSSGPQQARNLDRERRALVQARSTTHGSIRRAAFASEQIHQESGTFSARNQLDGIVTRVVVDGVMAQVEIAAGRYRLVALMSREAVEELDLKPGVLATAVVKATTVIVQTKASRG
jgi:molybdopterin-binding protein